MLLKTDNLGIPRFNDRDLIDILYTGNTDKLHEVLCESSLEVAKFNEYANEQYIDGLKEYKPLNISQDDFDTTLSSDWFMPDHYKDINLQMYLHDKLTDKDKFGAEYKRMMVELSEFESRGMDNVLRYMIYLVDFMREHELVWGVGRGSSVASYVLYLIGIHKVNSIQYELDWHEFLR